MTGREHECDQPFWRTPDSRWTCPDCGQMFVWTQATRTVPGVPASVCTVYENTWEPVASARQHAKGDGDG